MAAPALNAALLLLIGGAIVGVPVLDRGEAAVEASVRRYAAAVTQSDIDGAMAEIAPDQREAWRGFVTAQLGNVYEVRGIAVRASSLLGPPREVTTVMDVDRNYPDEFYQPTTRVGVTEVDGRWYLSVPLLAPAT